ncbi:hypothetical protein YC2023_108826 [Brassica napus]
MLQGFSLSPAFEKHSSLTTDVRSQNCCSCLDANNSICDRGIRTEVSCKFVHGKKQAKGGPFRGLTGSYVASEGLTGRYVASGSKPRGVLLTEKSQARFVALPVGEKSRLGFFDFFKNCGVCVGAEEFGRLPENFVGSLLA